MQAGRAADVGSAQQIRRAAWTRRRSRALLAWPLCALAALTFVATAAAAGGHYARIARVCGEPRGARAACDALVRVPVTAADAGEPGVHRYSIPAGAGPAGGLTPSALAGVYGFDPRQGGSGQTLAVIDAFNDPDIEADLAEFDSNYGIAECNAANGCLTRVSQTGSTTALPEDDTDGWSVETALDVEMAHSACPGCHILLVEAQDELVVDLEAAEDEAVALGATEVSNSWGAAEHTLGSAGEVAFNHPGVAITAASGDTGYYGWTRLNEGHVPVQKPNLPAALPSVVAVGGTSLEVAPEGGRASETVWDGNGPANEVFRRDHLAEGATGGGCSKLFAAPPWQTALSGFPCGRYRLVSDVSADGDPLTGFDIYDSYDCGAACERFRRGRDWLTIGGTSLSTPLIAAMFALAGGARGIPYPALTLYGHLGQADDLYDVTEGGNGFCGGAAESVCGLPDESLELEVDCEQTSACDAAVGYDGPSGVGAPASLGLFEPLPLLAALAVPGGIEAGQSATFSSQGSSDPYPGDQLSYRWSWGDGSSEVAGATAGHTYPAAGEYELTLTISDRYGLSATTSSEVLVSTQAPTAPAPPVLGPPPAPATGLGGVAGFKESAAPAARLVAATASLARNGTVRLRLACPAGHGACAGTMTVRALTGAHQLLAREGFRIAAGDTGAVLLHLGRHALALLEGAGLLHVRVGVLVRGAGGATRTVTRTVTLRSGARGRP